MPQHHAVVAHLFQSNSMRIASWNVNSVKARLDIIINWLKSDSCDVLLLQETKSQDENFPHEAFSSIGWHVAIHGQKSYNGVAIASRHQIDDVLCGLPWAGRITCLLYTSPSPRDRTRSRMPSSA